MIFACNIINEINLVVSVLNVIALVVFSIMNYKFQKKLTKHDITIRWLNDLINIKEETTNYFESVKENYLKCTEKKVIDVRNDLKVFDVLKKDFCESTIRYLEIIDIELYKKCIDLLEVFSDKLIVDIGKNDDSSQVLKNIKNTELKLYKLIYDYDLYY
ncbi:MAG: hypothetical protein IKC22_02205 [Bacilli bacterium]|nr:hypothetical protein [Bacilli bacterium]